MEFDVMTRATTWDHVATLARRTEAAGFSGMLFTEGHQVPWMNIAAAALAAPSLHFSTGIAIAFARSPMISAEIAWELAHHPALRQPVRQAGAADEGLRAGREGLPVGLPPRGPAAA
jgi:hypothetical protein